MSAAPAPPADDEPVAWTTAGGWRVVVVPRPASTTVALRWLVAAGGCHDGPHPGLSRLVERLVFHAATPRRRALTLALDACGGEAASQTTREYAEFAAVAPAPERQALLALVPLLARAPLRGADAVATQQATLLAALAAPPHPGQALWDLLLAGLWGDHPLAQPPGGIPASVAPLTPAHVAAHHAARYGPTHAVLAVAGACTIAEVEAAAAALPARPRAARPPNPPAAPPAFRGPSVRFRWAPGETAHVGVAVSVPGMTHPHRSALRLLDYVLGRGGSARLYRELRLRRGLAYTCHSVYMPYADAGVLAAQAVCAPAHARAVAALLADGLLDLAATPPTAAEVAAAQQRYSGSLYRSFETNASLTAILAVETVLAAWEPFAASAARVAAVTPDEVAAVARAYLTPERLVQATVGPLAPDD